MERYSEALDACVRCLAFDAANSSVLAHKERILKDKQAWERREGEKAERIRKENQEKRVIANVFLVCASYRHRS